MLGLSGPDFPQCHPLGQLVAADPVEQLGDRATETLRQLEVGSALGIAD